MITCRYWCKDKEYGCCQECDKEKCGEKCTLPCWLWTWEKKPKIVSIE